MVAGRNTLKRPVDRIEGAILMALLAVFGVAVVLAAILGTRTYQSQRAAAASLRPVAAVLIQPGPPAGSMPRPGQAQARWPASGGGERSGVLTTATVPGIAGAAAGTRVPVWLNGAGQPSAPPSGQSVMIIYALVSGGAATALAGVALLVAYAVIRRVLDRRRLAAWESAWAWTGPRWTARR
jgi:Ca2+/H+ antiporter